MDPKALEARYRRLVIANAPPPVSDWWMLKLAEIMRAINLQPRQSDEMASETDHSAVKFPCLLDKESSPASVATAWSQVLAEDRYVSAAEGLLFEMHFSMRSYAISQQLPKRFAFAKTLHVIRTRTGIALHDYARAVNWRRPILFVEVLKLAREYHRAAVSAQDLTRTDHRKEFSGRLGVSTVSISRFEQIGLEEAQEAVSALKESIEQGNPREDATPYLLEALAVQFDLTGDCEVLREALTIAGDPAGQAQLSVEWALSSTEIALRLHDEMSSFDERSRLRAYSLQMLAASEAKAVDAEDRIRHAVLTHFAEILQESGRIGVRGFRIPFGFRHPSPGAVLHSVVPALIPAIRSMAETGEPLARSIYADLLEHLKITPNQMLSKLRLAVAMRGAGDQWDGLTDERSKLLTNRDRLQISAITDDVRLRVNTMRDLILLSSSPTCGVAALVLISEDLEKNGACSLRSAGTWTGDEIRVADLIGRGDFRTILSEAAKDAVLSPDLSVSSLGGRSGVVTVSDYFDVVGGTFVFKETTAVSWLREVNRSEALRDALRRNDLDSRFGVVDHLSPAREELSNVEGSQTVNSVRRFSTGLVLSEYAKGLSRDDQVSALSLGADYLGHMNRMEQGLADGPPTGFRKEVKAKEVGRWLRRVVGESASELFEQYWSLYQNLPVFRRRDAHPLNWLVVTPDRMLAVDLEATGWRPLTYEVAQLTEDSCLLAPNDWTGRESVLKSYLAGCGYSDEEAVWSAFEASVFARSLRKLTPPTGTGQVLQHGHDVLKHLRTGATDPTVRRLALRVLDEWSSSRGLTYATDDLTVTLTDGRRRRLSRAMAYHLRHNRDSPRNPGGWVEVEDLAALVGQSATSREVILVASDFREPRFEVDQSRVRALYGHSVDASIERRKVSTSIPLFHSAPLSAAEQILTSHGLRSMKRTDVHLSSDATEALVAGRRKGEVILLTVEAERLTELRHAADGIYVAPQVPQHSLRVVPVWYFRALKAGTSRIN